MLIDETRGWPEISEQACIALMDGHLPPTGNEQAEAYFTVLRERIVRELEAAGYESDWLDLRELVGVYQGVFADLHRQVRTIVHRRAVGA